MSRFYIGQPVVCVRRDPEWLAFARLFSRSYTPVVGQRYVVMLIEENPRFPGVWGISIAESRWQRYWEDCFAPITENQVQAIIAQATDLIAQATDLPEETQRERETENV